MLARMLADRCWTDSRQSPTLKAVSGAFQRDRSIMRACLPKTVIIATLIGLSVAVGSATNQLRGDVLVLTGGGRVEGRWLNRQRHASEPYQMRLSDSAEILVDPSCVRERIIERPEESEYRLIAPTYGDSLDEQWRLAEWCRARKLTHQRATHLERVIELDPDHAEARSALGYQHLHGQWTRADDYRRDQGYQLYLGEWRLPQEIEVLEERRKKEVAERHWMTRLSHLRDDLHSSAKASAAKQKFLSVRDPDAVRALTALYAREKLPAARKLFIRVLAQVPSDGATETLMRVTLEDPDEERFQDAMEQLRLRKTPALVEAYAKTLRDESNARVNRAARALSQLEDRSAVPALIESLVTTHTVRKRPKGSPEMLSATLASVSSSAPGMGGERGLGFAKGPSEDSVTYRQPNADVLDALVRLTGVSFEFDQRAWKSWQHAQRSKEQTIQVNAQQRAP